MTRVLTEGFECQDIALIFTVYSGASLSSTARSGSKSLTFSKDHYANYPITADDEIYIRFGVYFSSAGSIDTPFLFWRSGTTQLGRIQRNVATGKLSIYTSTGTLVDTGDIALSTSVWYLIELHVKIADSGTIEVKVDGIADASFSGDTKPGADTTIDSLYFYSSGSSTPGVVLIDDLAVNNTHDGVDDSWVGDGHIIAISPNANGDSSQFTGSDGNSVDNYLLVDDVPQDGDSTYVEDGTSGHIDLYNMAAPSFAFSNVTVLRVWTEATVKNTVAGGTIHLGVKATTEDWDTAIATLTSYKRLKETERTLNHDTSSAWTSGDLGSIQVGVKVP